MRAGLTAVVAVLGLAACSASDARPVAVSTVATSTTVAPDALLELPEVKPSTSFVRLIPPAAASRGVPRQRTRAAPPVVRQPTTGPARGPGQVNGYPCGGDLPPCWVLRRESGGNPRAYNPTGCHGRGCGGLWQFDPRTWAGYGGYRYAQDAPADVQNGKARLTWASGRGCSHWAACG